MLGLSNNIIASDTGRDKNRVLKALNISREVTVKNIPELFEGIVEADETYIGGQWKKRRKGDRAIEGLNEAVNRASNRFWHMT